MTTQIAPRTITVALVGNPNVGKSTLFNALSGLRQKTANYPGVTVEKKIGHLTHQGDRLTLVDLPGAYSLAPRSIDEMVTVDVLLGRGATGPRPDVVLCVVDASNLQRNLYLVSQVLELGLPVVVALNMVDVARRRGQAIDAVELSRRLGVPVVPVAAHRREGLDALRHALVTAPGSAAREPTNPLPPAFQEEVARLHTALGETTGTPVERFLVERLLLDVGGYVEGHVLSDGRSTLRPQLIAARERLAAAGMAAPGVESACRYEWATRQLEGVVASTNERRQSFDDRLDRALTHRVWGTIVFLALMLLIFQAVFVWAQPPMEMIETGQEALGDWVGNVLSDGTLQSLLVDGVIAGVGGTVIFLPQILILFFFVSVLEDCGYMARAACLTERLMTRIGLSGKSFIPLLSSFACAIPGIMATRVVENRRDRLITILVAPLMSCSARLPVYTLLIAAFIPALPVAGGALGLQGVVMLAMYLVGIVAAVIVALVLKKTLPGEAAPPFVIELPAYHWPVLSHVLLRMLDRGWAFVKNAGTIILAVSIVIWALRHFPHDQMEGDYQQQCYLGRMGRAIEPVVRPLGWDWRIGCAVIASFPAREVVVATLGVIYQRGDEADENDVGLRQTLREATWDGTNEKVYNVPVALSIMVFFALCAQCASTLAIIRRETNSWRWPLFTFGYMTGLAYVAALVTYRVGRLFL